MIAEVGIIALFIAFLTSLAGTGLGLLGALRAESRWISAGRNAFLVGLPLISFVALLLIYAQVTGHYEISYVNAVSKDTQPLLLKITALWGGQPGSLILWTAMLSLFLCAALILNWRSQAPLMPWVMVVGGGTLVFFLFLNNFYENPFLRTWALSDGRVEEALFKPADAEIAYPYQSETAGAFFLTQRDAFLPNAPDARFDGRGLNPLLRHPGMIIHPPLLYLGFTGFIIPFAFALGALMKGDLSNVWIQAIRRWSVVAWMFLSIGIILGGRWASDVLGWGGYWGWDPVENSSLLPWLTGTAFLHSVMIQERRGMLKGWNMFMIMLTYLLVLFGTVATRTGLLSSVHSFAQSPLAVPMGLFLSFTIFLCFGLFLWRGGQGMFESDHKMESLFSRESLFLFNNWIFLALTGVVFWGTWSELITGFLNDLGLMANTLNLGPEYYKAIVPWLFGILFILMGVAPLAAWRKASAERVGKAIVIPVVLTLAVCLLLALFEINLSTIFASALVAFAGLATLMELTKGAIARHKAHGENYAVALMRLFARDRRRYGGYTIHLGVVVMGIGIIGSTAFQEVRQVTLSPTESLSIGPYEARYDRAFTALADDDRTMFIAEMSLWRDGNYITQLRPRRDMFGANVTPMTIAGTHSTLENDVYALITFWQDDRVTFRVYRNPLINFVWWGGVLFVLGTLIAIWPDPEPETLKRQRGVRLRAQAVGTAGD